MDGIYVNVNQKINMFAQHYNYLLEEYIVINKIGSGAFGEVYCAIDHNNNKKFAIKVEKMEKNKSKGKILKEYYTYVDLFKNTSLIGI